MARDECGAGYAPNHVAQAMRRIALCGLHSAIGAYAQHFGLSLRDTAS